jgi:hypothetical protein
MPWFQAPMQETQSIVYQYKVPCKNFGVRNMQIEARYRIGDLLILNRGHPTNVSVEIGVTPNWHAFREGTSPLVQPKVV